ncbi:hypothetical protein PV435_46105, partial [Streptomyces scabiei]|nr:hypothetical protein [Streptomyces scabiei]
MSKPPEPGRTTKRPTIEPTYVMRRRRTEALAELLREFEQFKGEAARQDEYETVAVPLLYNIPRPPERPPIPDSAFLLKKKNYDHDRHRREEMLW